MLLPTRTEPFREELSTHKTSLRMLHFYVAVLRQGMLIIFSTEGKLSSLEVSFMGYAQTASLRKWSLA